MQILYKGQDSLNQKCLPVIRPIDYNRVSCHCFTHKCASFQAELAKGQGWWATVQFYNLVHIKEFEFVQKTPLQVIKYLHCLVLVISFLHIRVSYTWGQFSGLQIWLLFNYLALNQGKVLQFSKETVIYSATDAGCQSQYPYYPCQI